MYKYFTDFLEKAKAELSESKNKPFQSSSLKPIFAENTQNSIFHQQNLIRLSKIEHGRIVMAVAECERASEHMQSALAALKGFEGINASQLWMAANFNHAYVYMLNEFLYQNSVRPPPVKARHSDARQAVEV